MKIPSEKSEDADPDALNKRYYIALSLHYGIVEEVVRVLSNPGTFEYDITKSLLRLRAKQADSAVQRDLIVAGKDLNEQVSNCLKAIEKLNLVADKQEDELKGGLSSRRKTHNRKRLVRSVRTKPDINDLWRGDCAPGRAR